MTMNNPVATNHAGLRQQHSRRAIAFYNVRLSDRDAWFGATIAGLFNAVGMLLELAIVRKTPGVSAEPAAVSAFVAVMLLVVLFIWRKTPSLKWASVIYSVNTASVVTVLLSTNLQYAMSGRNWEPFQATKLGCLIAALVAPGFRVGLLSILAFSMGALLQFEFGFPLEIKAQVTDAEPWPILAFGLGGVLALVYRFRRAQLEQEMARIQAQNLAIKQLADAFLNIRDLMNTPLQVLEFSIDLLRNSNEPPKPTIDRIDRSLQRLREINSVLVQHEKEIDWQSTR
jgi:hypothetical protein